MWGTSGFQISHIHLTCITLNIGFIFYPLRPHLISCHPCWASWLTCSHTRLIRFCKVTINLLGRPTSSFVCLMTCFLGGHCCRDLQVLDCRNKTTDDDDGSDFTLQSYLRTPRMFLSFCLLWLRPVWGEGGQSDCEPSAPSPCWSSLLLLQNVTLNPGEQQNGEQTAVCDW